MRKPLPSWSTSVLAVITIEAVVGAATTEWTAELMERAHSDAWLSVLVVTGAATVLAACILLAIYLHPNASPGTLFVTAWGTGVGNLIGLACAAYWTAEAARSLRSTVELLHYSVLPRTPTWALVAMGAAVVAPVLAGGLGAVVRFGMVLFWPTLLLAIVSLGLSLRFSDWGYTLPLAAGGLGPILAGVRPMLGPLLGLELLLVYLLFARAAKLGSRTLTFAAIGGTVGALAIYLYVTLVILVGFGPWEASGMTWPVLEAVRRVYLTGLFFERLDLLFLIIYLVTTASALSLYGYATLTILRNVFRTACHRWHAGALLLAVAAMAMVPRDLATLRWLQRDFMDPIGTFFLVAIPLMLIISGLWKRYRRLPRAQQVL